MSNTDCKTLNARNQYWDLKYSAKPDKEKLFQAAEDYIDTLEQENHLLKCRLAKQEVTHWPRIKNLPKNEQKPFRKWLSGQTCPLIDGLAYEEQDAFYPWDYDQWKRHLKGEKVMWD